MATFPNYTCDQFWDRIEDTVKKAASAGPALANAALLVAKGCPKRYTEALGALYTANHLPCPDFTVLFDHQLTVTPEDGQLSEVDEVQSILRHIDDVEEVPASVNEVLDILTEFDTFEASTQQSVDSSSLLKLDDLVHQVKFNAVQSDDNEDMLLTTVSEQDISFQDFDDSISFGNSPFAFTAPHLQLPSTPILSPICKNNLASPSTPAKARHRITRVTPIRNRLKDSELTPLRRTPSRSMRLARSMSTLSQATSTPLVPSRSSTSSRTQTPSAESLEDGESFLIISLCEMPTPVSESSIPHSEERPMHIGDSQPSIKSRRILDCIRAIIS